MQEANIENKLAITLSIISHMEPLLSKLHGQYLLHCGHELIPLVKKHTPYQFQISNNVALSHNSGSLPDFYGHYTAIPLSTDSIDIVLTPYLTEYEACADQVMPELLRVLKPNGYLCIVGVRLNTTQRNGFFRTLYSNIRRLTSIPVLSRHIELAGGIVVEKKHFFEWPSFKNSNLKGFLRDLLQVLRWIIPSRHHAFLIIAQKKDSQIKPIEIKSSLPLINTVKIHHANR